MILAALVARKYGNVFQSKIEKQACQNIMPVRCFVEEFPGIQERRPPMSARRTLPIIIALLTVMAGGPAFAGQVSISPLSLFNFQGTVGGNSVSLSLPGFTEVDYTAQSPADGLLLEYFRVASFSSPAGLAFSPDGTVVGSLLFGRAAYEASPPNGQNLYAFRQDYLVETQGPVGSIQDVFGVSYSGSSSLADLIGLPGAFSFGEEVLSCPIYDDFYDGTCTETIGTTNSIIGTLTLTSIDLDSTAVSPISDNDPIGSFEQRLNDIPEPESLENFWVGLLGMFWLGASRRSLNCTPFRSRRRPPASARS